jgi:hypothetical protein
MNYWILICLLKCRYTRLADAMLLFRGYIFVSVRRPHFLHAKGIVGLSYQLQSDMQLGVYLSLYQTANFDQTNVIIE